MDPGQRDSLIVVERPQYDEDDYGGRVEVGLPDEVARAWARVRYGTGQERREAAQERASQAATFECEYSPTLAAVLNTDRIQFDGDNWDIVSKAPLGHREIHFAAVRAA